MRYIFWFGVLFLLIFEIGLHFSDLLVAVTTDVTLSSYGMSPRTFTLSGRGAHLDDITGYHVLGDGTVLGRTLTRFFVLPPSDELQTFDTREAWLSHVGLDNVSLRVPQRTDDPTYWQVQTGLAVGSGLWICLGIAVWQLRRKLARDADQLPQACPPR